MKKIVSAAVAATLLAGAAFAEVNTSINARLGTSVFKYTKAGKKANATDTKTLFDIDGVTTTDAFTFKASNDYAGITLNYNPSLAASNANPAKNFWSAGNGAEYTAWARPTNWLTLKFGAHKDGIFWANQAKKDTDDTSWSAAGRYAFLNKLGIATKNSSGYFIDSLTDLANGGQTFGLIDFIFNNAGPGNLVVRLTGVDTLTSSTTEVYVNTSKSEDGTVATWEKSSSTTYKNYNWLQKKDAKSDDLNWYVAPGAMVAYEVKDTVKFNIDFQMASSKDIAAAAFVEPLGLLDNALTLVVGGTISKNLSDSTDQLGVASGTGKKAKADGSGTDKTYSYGELFYGVDLRARYVAGDFHIANAFNLTGSTGDGIVKPAGSLSAQSGNLNIWDAIFLTYKLNDKITLTGNVQVNATTGVPTKNSDGKFEDATWLDLYVTPGLMYTIGKGTTITTGLYLGFADLTGADNDKAKTLATKTTVEVPVIFRVKL